MTLWKFRAGESIFSPIMNTKTDEVAGQSAPAPVISPIVFQIKRLGQPGLDYEIPGDGTQVSIPEAYDATVEHILAERGFHENAFEVEAEET